MYTAAHKIDIPFLWRDDFDDTRLHAVFVYLLDVLLEAAELLHCRLEDWYLSIVPIMIWLNLFFVVTEIQVAQLRLIIFHLYLMVHLLRRRWCQGISL